MKHVEQQNSQAWDEIMDEMIFHCNDNVGKIKNSQASKAIESNFYFNKTTTHYILMRS